MQTLLDNKKTQFSHIYPIFSVILILFLSFEKKLTHKFILFLTRKPNNEEYN